MKFKLGQNTHLILSNETQLGHNFFQFVHIFKTEISDRWSQLQVFSNLQRDFGIF